MKNLIGIGINLLFLATIYFGLFLGNENVANIAVFFGWLVSVLSIPIVSSQEAINKIRKKGRSMPAWISHTFDLIALCSFIYHGYIWLSIFYVLHVLIQIHVFEGEPTEVKAHE